KRVADCRPPEPPKEPPKPPQIANAVPPPKPAPAPVAPPAPPPQQPSDGRMRIPSAPTHDFSFMKGCWRTDPFKHERTQTQVGVSSYCFDSNGNGSLEWRCRRTGSRTPARAQLTGST